MKWTNLAHEWWPDLKITMRRTGEYQGDKIAGPPGSWEQGFYDDDRVIECVEWRGHRWTAETLRYIAPGGKEEYGVSACGFLARIVNSQEADEEILPPEPDEID